ncbi:MAG TPA: putative glycoside hydrolase [Burkholderiaceae bacterium]|nr:putative glycoside hydrolase [Burkholderiaceae bacterium]
MIPLTKGKNLALLQVLSLVTALQACGGGDGAGGAGHGVDRFGTVDESAGGSAVSTTALPTVNSRQAQAKLPGESPVPSAKPPTAEQLAVINALANGPDEFLRKAQELVRIIRSDSDLSAPTPRSPVVSLPAKPLVGVVDYSTDMSPERQAVLAKFGLVILSGRGTGQALGAYTAALKTLNPQIKIAHYVAHNELPCIVDANSYYAPLFQEASNAGWWLYTAAGSKAQWTQLYHACDLNITRWAPRNAKGQSWVQFKAAYDYVTLLKDAPSIDYVFDDNVMYRPRMDADWKRIGTDQPGSDDEVAAAMRQGQAAYWTALRALKPDLKIIGNADNDLSFPEHAQQLDGAMQEAAIGASWSLETWAGWEAAMTMYRGQLRNSRSKDVVFEVRAQPNQPQMRRYGLASALLDDGYFMVGETYPPRWFDDYDVPIGTPVQAPPDSPAEDGIYLRRYSNGVVLVNPSKTSSGTIDIGPGYRRYVSEDQPEIYNGASERYVTLGPREGRMMIRE